MPRDASGVVTRTNGVFSGANTWAQQAASGDKTISSARHDTHDQDMADVASDSLSRTGKGGMQADLNLVNFKLINVAAGTAVSDGVNKGQLDGKLGAVVEDTSPQSGGNWDLNGFPIVTVSNADANITPDGTGRFVTPRATLGGVKYPDSDGTAGQVIQTDGAGQAAWTDGVTKFVSAEQTLPVNSELVIPHGLGANPDLVTLTLRCVTADLTFNPEDTLMIPGTGGFFSANPDRGISLKIDATNLTTITGTSLMVMAPTHFTGAITFSRWRVTYKAYLL